MNNMEFRIVWELRPCIVDGKKGLFHRWEDYAEVVGESPPDWWSQCRSIKLLYGVGGI